MTDRPTGPATAQEQDIQDLLAILSPLQYDVANKAAWRELNESVVRNFARRVADAERARILAALPAALNTTILRKSFPMDPFALAADLVTAIEKQQEAHQ